MSSKSKKRLFSGTVVESNKKGEGKTLSDSSKLFVFVKKNVKSLKASLRKFLSSHAALRSPLSVFT